MTDPQTQAWLDQEDMMVAQTIRKHGVLIEWINGDEHDVPPAFAYTVGLFGLGHPELVVCSLEPHSSSGLLNHLSERVRGGDNFVAGQLLMFEEWPHRVVVEHLPNPGEILLVANRHYQRPPEASVPAYQLTYDDLGGRFPWDDGYRNDPRLQPRPGTWWS